MRRASSLLLCSLLVSALGFSHPAAAGPKTKRENPPYPADFQARVRKAIERGVAHLRTKQLHDLPADAYPDAPGEGMDTVRYEEAAAVTWVLRRAGVPADDPAFAKAAKTLGARVQMSTEEAALLLLALCVEPLPLGNPFEMPAPAGTSASTPPLSAMDRAVVDRAVAFLLGGQLKRRSAGARAGDDGAWGTGEPGRRHVGIIPSTYLALLGLEAASRRGARVPARVWVDALGLLLAWQAPKGPAVSLRMNEIRGAELFESVERAKSRGFGLMESLSDRPTGYFSAAGVIGLTICQDALQTEPTFTRELREQTRLGIRDGLAWVQQNYDIAHNPAPHRPGGHDVDYDPWLQSLAHLAIHARMRFFGTHDWYQEGAEQLLKTQTADGSWDAIWWSNCYPLLFLLRASLSSVVPVITPSEGAAAK